MFSNVGLIVHAPVLTPHRPATSARPTQEAEIEQHKEELQQDDTSPIAALLESLKDDPDIIEALENPR